MNKSHAQLIETLKALLTHNQTLSTQQELCEVLEQKGYIITQSSLSRLLRKMGIIKVPNQFGQFIYNLPSTPIEPNISHSISNLITDIHHNEAMIVIHTNPGSAMLIASILDHHRPADIIGTVAGDDTVLIIPKSVAMVEETALAIRKLLVFGG